MSKIKNLFSTPKKALIATVCMIAFLAIIGTGTVFAVGAVAESKSIGKTRAEKLSFSDAGVDPSSAFVARTEFERENGQYVYEVEFTANGIEYDYIVNAADGAIIQRDAEGQTSAPQASAPSQQPEQSDSIGINRAKNAALADAKLSSAGVTYTKAQLDYDDGIQIYDIEFYTETTEYEYKINAVSGAVVDKSTEQITVQPSKPTIQPAENKYFGMDNAKKAVLADAKLSSADVTYTKAQLDYDDGTHIYDIEFYTATTEYEYEINAVSGVIMDKNAEAFSTKLPDISQQPTQATIYIGVDNAKKAAVTHAGTSIADVTFQKAKLENDDGRAEYEIEFFKDGIEYEYSIDAVSGSVLEYDSEYMDD